MKSEGVTADTALISDDLVNCVAKVKANATIFQAQGSASASQDYITLSTRKPVILIATGKPGCFLMILEIIDLLSQTLNTGHFRF